VKEKFWGFRRPFLFCKPTFEVFENRRVRPILIAKIDGSFISFSLKNLENHKLLKKISQIPAQWKLIQVGR